MPDTPASLTFLDYLAILLALHMPFLYIPIKDQYERLDGATSKSDIDVVTGSSAKLPIGELSDVMVDAQVSSIGLFEVSSDYSHTIDK